ncbi:Hint domain-containing protein [uncultured Tateyamaria sp.]|uniref:Hint domain-containing protein n=1 Tax=uncultured Tateyamaria sp. TaxID=455651 RepID=UPI00261264E7|nr:Hint domain-containing protein [uncultured Tateyamaria sp.]
MANYTVGGYAQNAFLLTPDGQIVLDPDFDASEDAIRYEIEEEDGGVLFNGDDANDEVGDGDQYARKFDANGNQLTEGEVYLEESWTLTDGQGNTITLYKVESNGFHSGWVADGPITPGTAYAFSGPNDVTSSNAPRYDSLVAPTDDPDDANTYEGGAYDDFQRSGAQDDTVYGYDGDDQIDGGAGNDNLYGGDGSDTIDGGEGDDYIAYGRGGDSVRGGDGNDTIDEAGGEPDYDYDDTIDAGAGDDKVYAGWGDDYIEGGTGKDELHGSDGNDTIHGQEGEDTIYGGDGADSITGGADNDLIYAGAGDDTVDGGAHNDTIHGEDGDDLLRGGSGNDSIHGGAGADTIDGGVGNDVLYGDDGNDRIDGGSGDDTVTGGAGDDTFVQSQNGSTTVTDFDIGDDDGDGAYNDQLDVSELRTPDGRPISVHDVVVTDDGNGNALLTFPEGETIVLEGVSPAQISSTQQLNAAGIPCFTAGTRIATARGAVPVEWLKPGDRVQTRDNGLRPIRWIGTRHVDAAGLRANPMLRPVHIAPGTFGNTRALRLSPQHAVALKTGAGVTQLVRAGHLARMQGGTVRVAHGMQSVTYHHLLLDSHDLVLAEGAACESFYPGPWGLLSVGPAATRDLIRLMPDLRSTPAARSYGPTVHPVARFGRLPPDLRDLAVAS